MKRRLILMNQRKLRKPVSKAENLFGFAQKSRQIVVGRDNLKRKRRQLQFILYTDDLAASSREWLDTEFDGLDRVNMYTSADIERLFQLSNTKIIGFLRSPLSQSIYRALTIGD